MAEEIAVFSLLGKEIEPTQVREEVAITCNIDASLIEDIYPCSPLQERTNVADIQEGRRLRHAERVRAESRRR